MSGSMKIRIELSGGAELLFDNQRSHDIVLDKENVKNLGQLLHWIKDNLLKERPELFIKDNSVRPGILVLVNDADWELLGQCEYELCDGDVITFISTLHGG